MKRLDGDWCDTTYLEPKGDHNNIFYKELRTKLRHPIVRESMTARVLSFLSSRHSFPEPFIFHSSYYRTSKATKAINIVTIHDFMPELFFTGLKRFYHSWRKSKAIQRADGIVCVSSNTRADLLRFYPKVATKRMITIPLGISSDYFTIAGSEVLHESKRPPYMLFVGRRSHYKNFDFALDVLRQLEHYQLIVAGEEWTPSEKNAIAPLKERISLVPNPTNEQMNILYNEAFCLLYPSSYEGFGIPVIEAMSASCPVVALNASSIPEVSNGAALVLDELTVHLFTKAIQSLESMDLRSEIIRKGLANAARFNWDRSVKQHSEFYQSVFREFTSAGERTKASIAQG